MAREQALAMLPELPPTAITPVVTAPSPPPSTSRLIKPLSRLVASRLFPGNFGGIDYRRLNKKIQERVGDYEPMAADVRHHQIESSIGSLVGIHVYPAAIQPRQVVIFCHGNIRPSRYMNKFLEQLSHNRQRVVVARDFVGYDMSSLVPNNDGALELAAIANDRAVYGWVIRNYPDAEIIVGGRSIGTTGWVNLISLPKVCKAFGIVPFVEPAGVVRSMIVPRFATWIPGATSLLHGLSDTVCNHAFPTVSSGAADFQTFGFSAVRTIEMFPAEPLNKQVLLFKAANDELVPATDAETLAQKLMAQCGIQAHIEILDGGHRALPGDNENRLAEEELEKFMSQK